MTKYYTLEELGEVTTNGAGEVIKKTTLPNGVYFEYFSLTRKGYVYFYSQMQYL